MQYYRRLNLLTFIKYFGWLLILEVMIGGAGRLFDFGGITLRMLFFITGFIIQFLLFTRSNFRFKKYVVIFSSLFLLITSFSIINGKLQNANNTNLIENVLMSSYFLIFPFFTFLIKTKEDVLKIIKLYKISSFIIAIVYLLFIISLYSNFFTINDFSSIIDNPEISFRSESALFYKGFIFMCCGFFFFLDNKLINSGIAYIIILPAIIGTFTRGFAISLIASYIIYYIFKNFKYSVLLLLLCLAFFSSVKNIYEKSLGDRSESDEMRVIQIDQVLERTNGLTFFIGHGFGNGVPIRDNHFEINYLEIFYKQGIIGLLFWITIFLFIILKYNSALKNNNEIYAKPFLLSTFFLYIQSASNPFLSNSMGITIIFLSIISLSVLSKNVIND